MSNLVTNTATQQLFQAHQSHIPCSPIREIIGENDFSLAYQVQNEVNTLISQANGSHLIGRKLAATSLKTQESLNISHPACGTLLSHMELNHNTEISYTQLNNPKIEVEIAFILKSNISSPVSMAELIQSIDWVAPAIEIVGSRMNWDVKITDMIADSMCASHFLLGHQVKRIDQVDLVDCQMTLNKNNTLLTEGKGSNCLGSPLNSLHWLANKLIRQGKPLISGETIITGALAPPVAIQVSENFEAHITGLGNINIHVVE